MTRRLTEGELIMLAEGRSGHIGSDAVLEIRALRAEISQAEALIRRCLSEIQWDPNSSMHAALCGFNIARAALERPS